jgi:hypothetical protein
MSNPLGEIAPFPPVGAVTAENLLRHETAGAYAHEIRTRAASKAAFATVPGSPEWRRYYDSVVTLAARFGVAFLLRQLREIDPARADEAAQHLHGLWLDGGSMPEFLFDWLVEAGIDPREVEQAVTSRETGAAA